MNLRQAVMAASLEFGLFDDLDETVHLGALSAKAGMPPETLRRLVRGLVHFGYCADHGNDNYRLSTANIHRQGGTLIAFPGTSERATKMLAYSVRTGAPAFEHAFGQPFFEYLDHHPGARDRFGSLMLLDTNSRARHLSELIEVSDANHLADVGGGFGQLTLELLRTNQQLRATILDRPAVVSRTRDLVRQAGLAERVEVVAGDFFVSVPCSADLYLYSQVLHDWDDDRCRDLLRICRSAMTTTSKLLLIEALIPDPVVPNSPTIELDLMMLMLTGGRERTKREYASLLRSSGLELTRSRSLDGVFSILEARPAIEPQGRD